MVLHNDNFSFVSYHTVHGISDENVSCTVLVTDQDTLIEQSITPIYRRFNYSPSQSQNKHRYAYTTCAQCAYIRKTKQEETTKLFEAQICFTCPDTVSALA